MSLDIDRSVMTSMKEDRHGEGPPGWGDLLRGRNLIRSVALCGSVALHAINLYLSTTILPSVVADIGGLDYYAWNTSVFVVASIIAAALSARLLARLGARGAFGFGAAIFVVGAALCALAPTMGVMLVGRTVQEIGRASCRERVWRSVGGGAVRIKASSESSNTE